MLFRGPFGGGAASGSSGSQVASHNRFGQYLRARTVPTNPATAQQSVVRNAVQQLASLWQNTLTASQRTAWETYAANVPVLNRLGDPVILTGLNMYTRSNVPRIQSGMTRVDAAPTTYDLGDLTPPTLTLAASGTSGTLTFTAGDSWVATSSTLSAMLLYTSRPQAASINFFKGPFRLAGKVNHTSGTASITTAFNNGATTGHVFWQVRVSRSDGRLTAAFPGSTVPA